MLYISKHAKNKTLFAYELKQINKFIKKTWSSSTKLKKKSKTKYWNKNFDDHVEEATDKVILIFFILFVLFCQNFNRKHNHFD